MANLSTGVRESLSKLLFCLAALLAVGGIFIFYFMSNRTFLLRGMVLLGAMFLSCFVASFSSAGKAFIAFSKDSVHEVSKVVWPTQREAVQGTLVVFGFVAVMAVYLCLTDKLIEWSIFSLILGWR